MPATAVSVPHQGTQSLIEKKCPDCGASVHGRTRHKRRCDDCARVVKLGQYRAAADKQRRKRGIPKVKGETFSCERCGADYVATSKSRQHYCQGCRPEVDLERARQQSKLRSASPARKARFNEWYRERAKGDPLVALARAMRTLMHRELGRKTKERGAWSKIVGYTADELKCHLERQFLPGMTWGNRGADGWHIDHIVPVSAFNYDSPEHPDFRACWALTNLRPMWASDNIRKKDKRLYLL